MPLKPNGHTLEYTKQEKHLGIEHHDDGKATSTISTGIQIRWQVAYALMGAGYYGLNGIDPQVSITLLKVYVIPAVMYGMHTLWLTKTDYRDLAWFHLKMLRCINTSQKLQRFPHCTC